jgi:hypothetical protein
MPDHVQMMLSIPPKYAVAQVVGFMKSAIHIARTFGEQKRNFVGQHFWARGYFVTTVGSRRGCHSRIHPPSGGGRPARRPATSHAAAGRLQAAGSARERNPYPKSRFERPLIEFPGSAGGSSIGRFSLTLPAE